MSSPNGGGIPQMPSPDIGAGDSAPTLEPGVQEELWESRALLLVLLLLILSFWVSYYLKVRRIRSIHETIVALFAGKSAHRHVPRDMISFKSTILLNVLLPPIILNSGYALKQEQFFRSFAVILTFAFAGTFISAVVLGVIVYLWSLLGLEGLSLTIIECLLFGSTLSATDPVTILAIFDSLGVDPKLYTVIFGESILNDAVSIVMFETLSQFHGEHIHILSFFHGIGIFLVSFIVAMAFGVIFGLACSLMLKHSELGRYTEIESCLIFLIAYTSYFFSNALSMSGIVSLLFCGVTLKHYAYHNMSRKSQRTTRYLFGLLAQLSENFIFIYLGLSLFTQVELVYKPMFILVTAFALLVARYSAVFPISKLINVIFRARNRNHGPSHGRNQSGEELPHSYQMMLFWAGLRGAVGVALAEGMKGKHAPALRTTVLVSVVLTVVVFGGTIGRMIEILGIRTGFEDDEGDSSDEEGGINGYHLAGMDLEGRNGGQSRHSKRRSYPVNNTSSSDRMRAKFDPYVSAGDVPYSDKSPRRGSRALSPQDAHRTSSFVAGATASSSGPPTSDNSVTSDDSDPDVLPPVGVDGADSVSGGGAGGDLMRVWRDGQWFTVLDERYLLPVFSNATASRRQATKKARLQAKRKSFAVEEEGGDRGSSAQANSPYLAGRGGMNRSEFTGSFTDIISSLVSAPLVRSDDHAVTHSPPETPLTPRAASTSTLDLGSLSAQRHGPSPVSVSPGPSGSVGPRPRSVGNLATLSSQSASSSPSAGSTSPSGADLGTLTPSTPIPVTSFAAPGSQTSHQRQNSSSGSGGGLGSKRGSFARSTSPR
ncbi:monovalent cation:H+ antiporter, CPA1 (nhx1) [Microbotryomycetes sp. JL201]|nr:monovalent cation:H+ antiporter, CPA1 (nhx1) [Microbotryomycetes sp. JL201]